MANNFKHKDISQIFDMVRDRDHYTVIRDFFELSAISIRNNFDHGNEYANLEKRYKEIAQGYKKEYLEGFATALGMLGKKIQDAVNGPELRRKRPIFTFLGRICRIFAKS